MIYKSCGFISIPAIRESIVSSFYLLFNCSLRLYSNRTDLLFFGFVRLVECLLEYPDSLWWFLGFRVDYVHVKCRTPYHCMSTSKVYLDCTKDVFLGFFWKPGAKCRIEILSLLHCGLLMFIESYWKSDLQSLLLIMILFFVIELGYRFTVNIEYLSDHRTERISKTAESVSEQ